MCTDVATLVPELYVSDIERSIRFYTEVLGFEVRYQRPEERFAYLDRSGAQIMIEQPVVRAFVPAELLHPYGRGVNLQIAVVGIDSLFAQVNAADSSIYLALEEKWYRVDQVLTGNRQFVVQDPDGYLLRFFESLGSKPI